MAWKVSVTLINHPGLMQQQQGNILRITILSNRMNINCHRKSRIGLNMWSGLGRPGLVVLKFGAYRRQWDPGCLLQAVQAAANGIFYWLIAGDHIQNEHCLNAAVYICIMVVNKHVFMTTAYRLLMANSIRTTHQCRRTPILSKWLLEFTVPQWPPRSPDLSPNRGLTEASYSENTVHMDLTSCLQEWRPIWGHKTKCAVHLCFSDKESINLQWFGSRVSIWQVWFVGRFQLKLSDF